MHKANSAPTANPRQVKVAVCSPCRLILYAFLGLLGRQLPRRLHVLDALGLPQRVPNQHLLAQGLHQPQVEPLPVVALAA